MTLKYKDLKAGDYVMALKNSMHEALPIPLPAILQVRTREGELNPSLPLYDPKKESYIALFTPDGKSSILYDENADHYDEIRWPTKEELIEAGLGFKEVSLSKKVSLSDKGVWF